MAKTFNVSGACRMGRHYMVALKPRLQEIKKMVDAGEYFTINKARQYGKTTVLRALAEYLKSDYRVLSLDFQRMSYLDFADEPAFVHALAREISKRIRLMGHVPEGLEEGLARLAGQSAQSKAGMQGANGPRDLASLAVQSGQRVRMAELFDCLSEWCGQGDRPAVLIIDEVDTATNNQVFLDFLAQLRAAYLDCDVTPTFQSVILAGVYDIRSIRRKIRPDGEYRENSPWNIAAKFRVDLGFSVDDITGMLREYEADCHTGMDIVQMAQLLSCYTAGYPYLVSWLCKCMDEDIAGNRAFPDKSAAWTEGGFLAAVKMLLEDSNPLFESLMGKLDNFQELHAVLARLLFQGEGIAYNADDVAVRNAQMFGLVKVQGSMVHIANRIFEARLYNRYLLGYKEQNSEIYAEGARQKNQFFVNGYLNVRLVLEKFVETFHDLYGERDETFLEEEGRRYFMLFLKPIINGVGNCSVEPRTRNNERMDLVIYYRGQQSIIEMKIWRGNAYKERGERQLSDYLDYFHLKKGYMLSFNFNKKKEIGVKEVVFGDKLLIEAVV